MDSIMYLLSKMRNMLIGVSCIFIKQTKLNLISIYTGSEVFLTMKMKVKIKKKKVVRLHMPKNQHW